MAQKLRLDVVDYHLWAHTSDVKPKRCKAYKIPNLVVYDSGRRGMFLDRFPLHVINVWRGQNAGRAEKDQSYGFRVLIRDNVSASQIESILRADGLYKYTFTGHVDGDAGINSYPDPWNPVSPAVRYTKYGISSMVLQACGSAATDDFSQDNQKDGLVKYNNWEINVAKAGVFVGYKGAVTLLDEIFHWRVAKGANRAQ